LTGPLDPGPLDLRLVEIFCLVCEQRSFSKAAERLRLSQPTVSSHIKTLERQVGASLLDRLGREVTPTRVGILVYEHGRRIVEAKRALIEDLNRCLHRLEGQLHIGASTAPGDHLLASLIAELRTVYPGIEVSLMIRDTAAILESLENGRIELGFVGARRTGDSNLCFQELAMADRLVLVAPAGSRWDEVTEVGIEQLRREPLVVREPGSGTRLVFEQRLEKLGGSLHELNVVAELGSTAAVKQAVLAGAGLAVVSRLAIQHEIGAGLLKVLAMPDLDPLERRFFRVTNARRALSPLCEAFLQWLDRRAVLPSSH
jgi:LysR family transcriptional regulator, transcriptional activator of the cysJI operon